MIPLSVYAEGTSTPNVIAVDFDGVLATYSSWDKQGSDVGDPIPKMIERVKKWIDEGKQVVIFSVRGGYPDQIKQVKEFCKKHIGRELDVTNVKKYTFAEIWDDICIHVEKNTGETK
jgi:histidinol phosphatase-like enzyme